MELEDIGSILEETEQVLRECFNQFQLDEVFLSFNGGKDCTALLDITISLLKDIHKRDDIAKELKIVYIRTVGPFREIENFVKQIEEHYGVKLMVMEGEMKTTLQRILERDSRLKACLMGTRRTDPYSEHLKFMQKTDPNWPQVMRVSPLLNWSYHQIWSYILQRQVPYCSLYDMGYTSIGSIHNTQPNPALEYTDKHGRVAHHPAWLLTDASLERAGRGNTRKTLNGHTVHTLGFWSLKNLTKKQERPSEASRNFEDSKKKTQESEQQSSGLSANRLKRSDNDSNRTGPSQQSSYDNSQSLRDNQPIDSAQHQQINPYLSDFIDSDDEREKNTELFSAIKNSNLQKVQELLKAGVKVNIIDKNNKDNTPLHYAIEREKVEIAAELLQEWKADINVQNNKGDTPLHISTSKGNIELVKLLLSEKAEVNIKNNQGYISLDIAKSLGKQGIVQILESNISPNSQTSVEEQLANWQKSQENLRSASTSGYMQSSSQPSSKQNSEKIKIQKRGGTTSGLDGHFYEIDLLILGKLRGDRDINKFYLSTNVDGLGAFDDVVIRYWKNNGEEEKSTTILLQAKHVNDSKKGKVTIEKFKNPKNDKFYLGEYFSDYLNSREKFNDKSEDPVFHSNSRVKYIIYTNAILDERFDKNRKIDIDNSIFSTKSKEDKDKAFKFSLDDKNHDIIATLENVSCQERIKLLAKALVSCISGKLNYNNMMGNEFFLTYHVFLAKNVIDVREEIKEDGKKNKYREGKINHNFLNIDNEDLFKKVLIEEVFYEYARNVIFNKKSSSILDDESERNNLVNKVVKSLKSSKKVDEDVIEKLGGIAIILDTKKKQLKFAVQDEFDDCKKIKFIEDLKSKVNNLADYKFDIPYELVKKLLKEKMKREPLKLSIRFGNISPSFKKPEHLIKKLIELFEKHKSQKVIKIDDSVVGHGKELTNGDIKNIGKLVGNLLIFDEKEKVLKLASEENLKGNALDYIKKLKSTAQSKDLEVSSYRFDIKVKNFPREILVTDDEDKTNVKEFLSKLEVFTGQASDKELKEIIKEEIRNLYKLTKEEVEENFLKIREKGEEYWRKGDYYLEKDDDLFANILKFGIAFDVRYPVALFTGREEELGALHNKIQRSSKKVTVISGLGGIGKTELARKYAYDHGNDYDGNVIWINAESYQTLVESFLRLAQDKLEINVKSIKGNQKDIKSIVEDVYGFFSKRKSLFIFDNAEKRRTQYDGDEGIDNFLPSLPSNANKPYILITSRNQKWGNIKVVPLGTFTEKETTDFIRTALNIKDDTQKNEIQKLMEILERFPLALTQVVAYIKQANEEVKNVEPEREFKIDNYLREYKKKTKELLNFPFPDDSNDKYSRTTFTTLQVTIDKIKRKEHGKKALEILDIIAYCAPDNIPTKIFLKLGENDERKLGATVQLLKQYSMVNLERGVLSVHRLVQEVIRINLMDEKREEETLRKALESIKSDDLEKIGPMSQCIFFPLTEDGKLSDSEKHATYIWSYASKYDQLIKDFYSAYGKNGNAPLHLFAINGKKEAIESILKNIQEGKLMDKVNEYNQIGYAPIHLAALNGHKEVVKYLVEEQGVDIDFITKFNDSTPTFIAVLGRQLDVVKYLVGERRADPNKGGKFGLFPILFAALYARKDLIECLINNNANLLLKDKLSGNNVLHFALLHLKNCVELKHISNTEEVVKYCLEKNYGLVKDANICGMTPLHFAAEYDSGSIVKILLDYGADVNAKSHPAKPQHYDFLRTEVDSSKEMCVPSYVNKYDEGYTPLHIAAKENHYESVKLLLQKGAIYRAINDQRSTALDIAELGSDVEDLLGSINLSFQAVLNGEKDELVYLLKRKGNDVLKSILNARDRNQKTLLQVAITNKQKDIEKALIEKLKTERF